MTCANYKCDNTPFGNRIRCGKCRKHDINECVGCDVITNRGAFYCEDCKNEHNIDRFKTFRKRHPNYTKTRRTGKECSWCAIEKKYNIKLKDHKE
jgi:hypothetical protein